MRPTRTLPKSVSSKAATTPFSVTRSLDGSDLVNNNINNPSPLPFIFIPVNNMYIKALVDTGATRTIIQQEALNRIRHKRVYPAQQCYHLADGASSLSIIGYVDLEIRIQHVRTYVTAAVAKSLSCPLILGQDWITYYHVDYNSSTNRLSVYNNIASVPIERVDKTTFPVRLVQQIVLEPKSEHVVEVHVPISSSSAVLFHPNQKIHQIKSIIIPHSLLHVDKYVTKLTIYNPNMYSCRLPANTNVGTIKSLSSGDTISNVIDSNIDTTTMLTDDNNCKRKQRISQYAYSDSDCLGSKGDYDNCYYQQYISSINEQQQSNTSKCINMMTNTNTNHLPSPINVSTIIQDAIKHITNRQQQQQLYAILRKYDKIFYTSSPTIAKTTIPHAIRTADHPPVNSRPYRGSEEQQRALQQILKIMSASNQVRPSTSPWSSPLLLVKKKDGDYRFVVDYRKLNSVTIKDSFPIPTIEATLKQLSGHSYFTKLDLKSGYFQIPIQEEDKQKTAFITTTGLWEFNVLQQGLKNAPPSFQRIMYNLLVNKREHYCLVYLDDIIIFSKSFNEHIHHLDDILSSLYKHNFQLNPPKCFFVKQQIDYLGHTIDTHGSSFEWYRPISLNELILLRHTYPGHQSTLVFGNTRVEFERRYNKMNNSRLISITYIKELQELKRTKDSLYIGAGVTFSHLKSKLMQWKDEDSFCQALLDQMKHFASTQIRNVASIGGNIITAAPDSDINPILEAAGAILELHRADNEKVRQTNLRDFFLGNRRVSIANNEILVAIHIPLKNSSNKYFLRSYKQARRRDDSKGIVSAAFNVELEKIDSIDNQWKIVAACFSFGGMASKTISAINTQQQLIGLPWTKQTINQAYELLIKEMSLDKLSSRGQYQYRQTLVQSFLFKFYSYVSTELRQSSIDSIDSYYHREVSHGQQTIPERPVTQKIVGSSLSHQSAYLHTTGEAIYIDDMPSHVNTLYAALVLSTQANARIKHIDIENASQVAGFVSFVNYTDVQGSNNLANFLSNEEIFVSSIAPCVGAVIGLVVCESEHAAKLASTLVKVEYDSLLPRIFSIDDAIIHQSYFNEEISAGKGDTSR
ncbi:unnamed protein product [Rotaria sp. Silwood2]|nr:unnamed protein product [Rotaria sp. Silwood2]